MVVEARQIKWILMVVKCNLDQGIEFGRG